MSYDYDWTQDVIKTGGRPGAHWLGNVEKSALPARLHLQAVEDPVETEKKGRPVFQDRLFITILLPGKDSVVREVQEMDKYKWPAAFEAWERDQSTPQNGTPLEEWPQITPGAIATLKASNVMTVEGLLALSDVHVDKIGPVAAVYQKKARQYVERAEGTNRELEEVKAQNAELAEQLKEIQAKMAEMTKPKRRGPKPGTKYKPRKAAQNVPSDDHTGRDGSSGAADA